MLPLILNELRDPDGQLVARGDMDYINARLTVEFGTATLPRGWFIRVYTIPRQDATQKEGQE